MVPQPTGALQFSIRIILLNRLEQPGHFKVQFDGINPRRPAMQIAKERVFKTNCGVPKEKRKKNSLCLAAA